jgi:hypothetical protein
VFNPLFDFSIFVGIVYSNSIDHVVALLLLLLVLLLYLKLSKKVNKYILNTARGSFCHHKFSTTLKSNILYSSKIIFKLKIGLGFYLHRGGKGKYQVGNQFLKSEG